MKQQKDENGGCRSQETKYPNSVVTGLIHGSEAASSETEATKNGMDTEEKHKIVTLNKCEK